VLVLVTCMIAPEIWTPAPPPHSWRMLASHEQTASHRLLGCLGAAGAGLLLAVSRR